jgi:hypothetical protein
MNFMLDKIELRPGDLCVVKTPSRIAGAINAGQRLLSRDRNAEYNHALLIVDKAGNTFESLTRIDHYKLTRYDGCKAMIVRHTEMEQGRFNEGYAHVLKYDGKMYPWWRLPMHFLRVAQYVHWSYPVCSELVGLFLNKAGLFNSTGWGWSPDDLADLWDESKYYDTVFKGEL